MDLSVRGVSKTYGNTLSKSRSPALLDATLDARRGEILALLGLNGAGKTTLIKILAGLVTADTGSVEFDRIAVNQRSYTAKVGAVFEGNRNIYWRLTAFENLEYFGVLRGLGIAEARTRANQLLDMFQLTGKRDEIAARLSRGMQQRLAIALALVHRPGLLLLDEPTLGVDIENVIAIIGIVRALADEGVCVILTSHQMDVVNQLADRIGLLSAGRLIAMESRDDFLSRTGEALYTLDLVDDLDGPRVDALIGIGAVPRGRELSFAQDDFYEVMRIIEPLRISYISNGKPDLTRVFMDRIKECQAC
jgi:ABC-2 type transport system ATP-binding protein